MGLSQNLATLDFYFPFVLLIYGAVVSLVTTLPYFQRLIEMHSHHPAVSQLKAHQGLGLFCLMVGALWSLQNLMVPTLF